MFGVGFIFGVGCGVEVQDCGLLVFEIFVVVVV